MTRHAALAAAALAGLFMNSEPASAVVYYTRGRRAKGPRRPSGWVCETRRDPWSRCSGTRGSSGYANEPRWSGQSRRPALSFWATDDRLAFRGSSQTGSVRAPPRSPPLPCLLPPRAPRGGL
jgi:hypothetical protein